jgi:cysteine synthase A
VKYEAANPSGSAKDRMALSMVVGAERSGRLSPGQRLVELSGGSTGTALALVCAVKGYELYIVASDAFADEKIQTMRAFGATVELVPSKHGKSTYPELFDEMRARVVELSKAEGTVWLDQSNNPDNPAGYHQMAREILEQTGRAVDAFVMSCGSGGCFSGNAVVLKKELPGLRAVAVEPAAYRHLSGGPRGVHHIDGIGDGPPPKNFRMDLVDEIIAVTDEQAFDMARTLAKREGIFAGKSSAANVVASLQVAERLGPGRNVVTVICDTGYKYLQGSVFR